MLPKDFMTEHEIEDDWLIALQHGKEYKEMVTVFKHCFQTGVEIDKDQFFSSNSEDKTTDEKKSNEQEPE